MAFPYSTFSVQETSYGGIDEETGEQSESVMSFTLGDSAYGVQFDFVTIYVSFEDEDIFVYLPLEFMGMSEPEDEEDETLHFIKIDAMALLEMIGEMPEGMSDDLDEFRNTAKGMINNFTKGAKDKFDIAVFDETKNAYILNNIDYTVEGEEGEEHVYGASYEIVFTDGKMTSFKETFYNDAEHSDDEKVVVEITDIDSVAIEFPEVVENSVTKEQFEAAFDESYGDNARIYIYMPGIYANVEFDNGKFHMSQGGNDMYAHYDGETIWSYVQNEDYEWGKVDVTDSDNYPATFAEFEAQYQDLFNPYFAPAKNKYNSALWLGDNCIIAVGEVSGLPAFSEQGTFTLYGVQYMFSVKDGKFDSMSVSGYLDESDPDNSSFYLSFRKGEAEITLPDESEAPYVTESEFTAAIDNCVTDNFGLWAYSEADEYNYNGEFAGNLYHHDGDSNDNFYVEYVEGEDYYYNYSYDYNDGNWIKERMDFQDNGAKTPAENVAQYKDSIIDPTFAYAKNNFADAFWRGSGCKIESEKIENFTWLGQSVTVYNVKYELYFNDGTISSMSFTAEDEDGKEYRVSVSGIGYTDVHLPELSGDNE